MFSAIKLKGKPLYKYARQGVSVERKAREICIYDIKLLSFRQQELMEVELFLHVSKGTYIRSLVRDIAKNLNCAAVLSKLQRTVSANHSLEDAHEIENLNDKNIKKKIIDMGDALRCIDKIQCLPEIIDRIKKGQKIFMKEAELKSKYLRLFDENNEFLGILENSNGLVSPKRLISIEN